MDTPPAATKYKNHRFPAEIISHAVWLYFRFCLSYRDVEELLLERRDDPELQKKLVGELYAKFFQHDGNHSEGR